MDLLSEFLGAFTYILCLILFALIIYITVKDISEWNKRERERELESVSPVPWRKPPTEKEMRSWRIFKEDKTDEPE